MDANIYGVVGDILDRTQEAERNINAIIAFLRNEGKLDDLLEMAKTEGTVDDEEMEADVEILDGMY